MTAPPVRASAPRFQTIRARLAIALAVALLPVLVLGALQSQAAWRREADNRREDLVLAAERSAAGARARIESAAVLLETLSPESVGVYCVPRLRQLVGRLEGFDALVRYSASGRPVCASGGAPENAAGDVWFARLEQGENLVVERAPGSVQAGEPALLAAVRAERPLGDFDGAFVAVLPVRTLAPQTRDRGLPPGSEVAVTDGTGRVLTASSPQAFEGVGGAWTRRAAQTGSVLFRQSNGRGERDYAGAPLAGTDVFVLISTPAEGPLGFAVLNPVQAILTPLLAWAFALAAVMIVTERVVIRWLGYLERIASIYAKGRFTVRPVQARNAPQEIRALAATLDEMADTIDARDASLRDSLAHKDALLREIHHRVKNNLQVISSLLNMQQRSLTDPGGRAAINDTRQRITALALIYRALYQSPDLRRVDVRGFLEELIAQLVSSEASRGPAVRTELDADTLVIDPDKLAPLALWAVEAITNAQKHAFAGRGGSLRVRFRVDGAESRLEVEDDGPGRPEGLAQGVGRTLMTAFARQLRGQASFDEAEPQGLIARLSFPTPEAADSDEPDPHLSSPRGNPAAA